LFVFQVEDGIRDSSVTGVQTCALPIFAAATTTAIGIWTPLGPAPLASDATGFGQQDYGWVSGRATAVAVDPADATGNTVYIGGRSEERRVGRGRHSERGGRR